MKLAAHRKKVDLSQGEGILNRIQLIFFNFTKKSSMIKNYRIVVPEGRSQTQAWVDEFYLVNGYHKSVGRSGTKYIKSIKSSIALSPKRISSELLLRFDEKNGKTLILIEGSFRSLTGHLTSTDQKYFDDFIFFMDACMMTGVIEKFNVPTLDGIPKNEKNVKLWLLALLVLTLFPLLFLTDSVSRFSVLFIIGISLFLVITQGRRK